MWIGVDESVETSLEEYGLLWNPSTEEAFLRSPTGKFFFRTHIGAGEVREALLDAGEGYFHFMGISRENAILEADEDHGVADHIQGLQAYYGYWTPGIYMWTLEDVLEEIEIDG